jgi:hypothetical protein
MRVPDDDDSPQPAQAVNDMMVGAVQLAVALVLAGICLGLICGWILWGASISC